MPDSIHIGFLVYPGVTQLDFTGPAQVLSMVPGAIIHLVWKDLDPVMTDAGFAVVPTDTFEDCRQLDVLCLPGGTGQRKHLMDASVVDWVKNQAAEVDYTTSVCTGALFLGMAGLLKGKKSACHWAYRDVLANFGAEVLPERVVQDGRHVSGGGVTAGLDFAFTLAAELAGEDVAKEIQLVVEYDPHPPFDSGTPEKADPKTVAAVRERFASL